MDNLTTLVDGIERSVSALFIKDLLSSPRYAEEGRLLRSGFKVYSQQDEDGIIQEIFKRIGTTDRRFVEFGVGNGLENNSAFLILQGWKGLWIEGSASNIAEIGKRFAPKVFDGTLAFQPAFITRDNIDSLIASKGFSGEIDLLSVDIDGNDWHVIDRIVCIKPRVIIAEYNPTFPPSFDWKMPYDENYVWDGTMWIGASLKSLELLLAEKGYSLVGCGINGGNAFFVRSDLAKGKFHEPFTAENHYEPLRSWMTTAFRPQLPMNFKAVENKSNDGPASA